MAKSPIDFSIGYQNIDGLHCGIFNCKLPYLEEKFIHDIEILSETWDSCKHDKNIQGYRFLEIKSQKKQKVTKGRSSGGLLIYIKNHLFDYVKKVTVTPYFIWLEIEKSIFLSQEEPIQLCIAYNPPESSPYCNKNFYDEISLLLLKKCHISSPFLLIGDLNARTGELEDFEQPNETQQNGEEESIPGREFDIQKRANCDKKSNPMGTKLLDLCKMHDLQILNGRTAGDRRGLFTFHDTMQGASAIDIAIASDTLSTQINSFVVLPQSDISRHCKIVTRIKNLKGDIGPKKKKEYPWIPVTKNYKWTDNSAEKLSTALNSILVSDKITECNLNMEAGLIDPAAKKLAEVYTIAADAALETKKKKKIANHQFKHKKKPRKWYDDECRNLKNISRKLAILKQQNPSNIDIRSRHNIALKEYKKICITKKQQFEQSQIAALDQMLATDPVEFWKKWKSFGDTYSTDSIPNADGERWEKYFRKLFENNDTTPPPSQNPNNISGRAQALNAHITMKELTEIIKSLKNKKAAGLDKITAEFLKASPERIKKVILQLLNLIFTKRIVPKDWCIGVINPIHKDGCKEDPDNYRGICISSVFAKLLSTIMNKRLNKFLEDNKILHKSQIGFTLNNRTADHLHTLRSIVNKYVIDGNDRIYTCFIDFRKAFDTVWHDGLFHKLEQIGVTGNFLDIIRITYKNTRCAVRLGDNITQFFPCKQGVRQGDPLSPTLFNIFLNDLFTELENGNCDPVSLDGKCNINALAYADDIVLISKTKAGLQKALDIVEQYCETWRLKINHSKTKTMVFSRGNRVIKAEFTINGTALENVKEFKYLGITIHKKNCTFTPTLKYLRLKATRAFYALKSKVNIYKLPLKVALKLLDSVIKPILLYCSEVWEPYLDQDHEKWDKENDIEKAYLQFLKQLLGVNRSTTNALIRGELDRHSLQEEILRRNINYTNYLSNKEDTWYAKQAYLFEISRNTTSTSIMTSIDRYTADMYQIHEHFLPYKNPYQNLYDLSNLKLKRLTYQLFHSIWTRTIGQSTKADTYKKFKGGMKYEPYLDHTNRSERVAMTKLRTSDHKLMIEELRRRRPKPPREERTCFMCHDKVEDEIHFLTDCRLYGSYDQHWGGIQEHVPQIRTMNNAQKFEYIMIQEDPEVLTKVLKMVHELTQLRKFLYETFYDQ